MADAQRAFGPAFRFGPDGGAKVPALIGLAWVACVAYLAFVPWVFWFAVQAMGHDAARMAQLPLMGLCALAIAAHAARWRHRPPSRIRQAGVVLAMFAAGVSVLRASHPEQAAREAALLLGLCAIAWAVSLVPWAVLRRVLPGLITTLAAGYAVLVLALFLLRLLATGRFAHDELFVGYDNMRFYNHVQVVSMPLLAAAAVVARSRLQRGAAWGALALGWAMVAVSSARATGLALVAGLVAVAWAARASGAPWRRVMLGAALAGVALHVVLFVAWPAWVGATSPGASTLYGARLASGQSRGFLWQLATSQFAAAPWFGIGPMHYAGLHNPKAAHPHNLYLQVLAEWGLIVAVCALAGWWAAARALWGRTRQVGDAVDAALGAALLAAGVGIAVDACFSGNLVMPVSQVWIAVWAGLAVAWVRAEAPIDSPSADTSGRAGVVTRSLALALLGSQLWLAAQALPEALNLRAHLHEQAAATGSLRAAPRFWSYGWL